MSKSLSLFLMVFPFVVPTPGCARPKSASKDQPGTLDAKSGDLVAFWLQRTGHSGDSTDEPILVRAPYTVWIVWSGQERRFHIYDNISKTMFKTTEFEEFLERLDHLPRRVEVLWMDTCCGSQAYDMPPSERQRLEKAMGDRTWAIDRISGFEKAIICTCESKGFRYP